MHAYKLQKTNFVIGHFCDFSLGELDWRQQSTVNERAHATQHVRKSLEIFPPLRVRDTTNVFNFTKIIIFCLWSFSRFFFCFRNKLAPQLDTFWERINSSSYFCCYFSSLRTQLALLFICGAMPAVIPSHKSSPFPQIRFTCSGFPVSHPRAA